MGNLWRKLFLSNYQLEELLFYHTISYSSQVKTSKSQKLNQLPIFNKNDNFELLMVHKDVSDERSLSASIFKMIDLAIENDSFLLISSYYFNNYEIINALKQACIKLKGKIYILVGDEYALNDSINREGEIIPEGLIDLARNGAQIRKKVGAHLKFIVSGEKCIIMSTNLTTEGLFVNPEYGIVIDKNNPIFESLKILFSNLWHQKSEVLLNDRGWINAPNWNVYGKKLSKIKPLFPKLILSSNSIINEINSYSEIVNPNSLFDEITSLLINANELIEISIYSLVNKPDNQINKIYEILIDKSGKINVHILVPQIKLRNQRSQKMLEALDKLLDAGAEIRFYRELHGKIIIVDKKEALFLTGNLDEYLVEDNSYDIGCFLTNHILVDNIRKLYNHLWEEASDLIEPNRNLKLKVNLVIESQDYLSSIKPIPVFELENRIKKSPLIRLFYTDEKSLLQITDKKGGSYSIEILHSEEKNIDGEFIFIKGVINQKWSKFNKRNSKEYILEQLRLNMYWKDIV